MLKQTSLVGEVNAMMNGRAVYSEVCCKKCPLKKADRFVPPDIVKGADIIFVGEAPGATEVIQHKPFVGKTGKKLRGVINKLDILYSVTNCCHCRPINEKGDNRAPTLSEMKCCSQMLFDELENYKDIVIVGGVALAILFPDVRLSDVVGSIIRKDGKRYLVVYHPSYIDRVPEEEEDWLRDLGRVEEMLSGYDGPFQEKVIGRDISFEEAIKDLESRNRFDLDIETSSLNRFDFKLYCIGLYGYGCSNPYIFPYQEKYASALNSLLKGKEVVVHNAFFETTMLDKVGISLADCIIYDTMFMAYLMDERHRDKYGLKQLARRLLGYRYWNLVVDYNGASAEELYKYNGEDLYAERIVFNYFWERLSQKQKDLCKIVMSDAFKAVSEIEDFGMKVDLEGVSDIRKRIVRSMEVIVEELKEYGDINWNSPLQVGELLVKMGVKKVIRTKTKRVSLDKDAVKYMMEDNPNSLIYDLLSKLSEYNKLETLLSTFIDGTLAKVGVGGRVRSSYNLTVTVTGRSSSSNPNLQNVPVDSRIKNLFVPEEGYVFLEGDGSQIELRVTAVVAREETMLKAFREGRDLHRFTAARLLGIDESKVTKDQRQKAKATNFGLIYGQGWQGLQAQAKSDYGVILTNDEAKEWRKGFFDLYGGLAIWHDEVESYVKGNGYVESPFGRLRRLEEDVKSSYQDVVEHAVRQAINSPIQGSASDIIMMLMGRLYRIRNRLSNKKEARLVATVHDEFMLELLKSLLDEGRKWVGYAVDEVQKALPWFDAPIVIDLSVLDKWQ